MDAHLAALAQEFHAVVVSYDNDLAGFPGVTWETPATEPAPATALTKRGRLRIAEGLTIAVALQG